MTSERPRSQLPTTIAGLAAALFCNFWVLEGLLAKRNDLSGAWISDLAARSQAYGWRFQLLEVAAGLAIAGFAALLLREAGDRPAGAGGGAGDTRLLRRGLLALLAAGALAALGGAAPLNCAEALERTCDLSYDPFDLLHTIANLLEVVALAAAFALVGIGLARTQPRLSRATLAIGTFWLLLMALAGIGYLVGDVGSAKGLFQRGGQLLLGTWLALLGLSIARLAGPVEGH